MNINHTYRTGSSLERLAAKPVNLKYLYEVVAIPEKVRDEYLRKISRRMNSSEQKNVRLLKIIYWHLYEDRKIKWDDERICRMLGINKNMLYGYKSRLLRGLRELYFGWKKIEKKEFGNKDQNDLKITFDKANRMLEVGMKKEAKNIFLRISNRLSKKKKKSDKEKFILFETLNHLCNYYYSSNTKLKDFNKYYNTIERLGSTIISRDKELYSYIMIKIYYCRAYKTIFHEDKSTAAFESLELLKSALREAKHLKDKNRTAIILLSISSLYDSLKKYDDAERCIREGLKASQEKEVNIRYIAFKTYLRLLEEKKTRKNFKEIRNEIITGCDYIRNTPGISFWSQQILFLLLSQCSLIEDKILLNKILYEFNSRAIIYNGLDRSLRMLYYMKFNHYMDEVAVPELQIDTESKKQYISVRNTSTAYQKKLDNAILELTVNTKKVRDIFFRKEFFMFMLCTDFWKGSKCSYEYSEHIMKQIDYINKTRPAMKNTNKEAIDNAFLGISMMSEFKILTGKAFLKKYEMKYKRFADSILERKTEFRLSNYYMLSFIAEQCGMEELKGIAKKTFHKIEEKYPGQIKEEIERIKKSKSTEYNEQGLLGIKAA